MYNKFEDLLSDLKQSRPNQQTPNGPVYFFNDHPVWFGAGEMEGVHWVDIHIELKHFMLDNLNATKKVLQANREMGMSTPIPTWFAINEKNDRLILVNRLDWRHISCKILEDHVLRCIEQMGEALRTEGV